MSTTSLDVESFSRARTAMCIAGENHFVLLEAVAEIDITGTGYPSVERLLEDLFHIDRRDAKRLVRHAEALVPGVSLSGEPLPPRAPATAGVCATGQIGPAHVEVVLAALARLAHLPTEVLTEAEEALAEAATYLPPRALAKVADRLVATLDPDGVAPDDAAEPVDELHLGSRRDGALNGAFRFHHAADRELIREVLDLIAHAASPTGIATSSESAPGEPSHPTGAGGETGRGHPPARPRGRATFTVTMDLQWLRDQTGHATLDSGSTISPAEARRIACDAGIVPMVLGTRAEPLDVGRLSYTIPEGMRRALILRDGGCAFPGCTRRPGRCAAHHCRHWADGGETTLENLTLLCRYHHRLVHQDHWRIRMCDGRPWFIPPRFIDPQQLPRPGGRCRSG